MVEFDLKILISLFFSIYITISADYQFSFTEILNLKRIANFKGLCRFSQFVPAIGKVVPCRQPLPVKASPPLMKDNASINMKYLDVDQGMNSSYVL